MTPEVKQRIEQIRQGDMPEGYKKTISGIAPVEWTDTCLGEIYTERKEPGNETLPLLMVSIHSGVSDGEVDEDDLPKKVKRIEDKSQYKRAATGDLVFNMMRAWQGAIGTVRTEGMVSPAYIVAEPNNMVDPLFMDYYMKTNRMVNTIHRQSYGVTDFRLRLYWDSFAPIKCVLPAVAEQQKIAAILTTQDKVIELKEKRLAEKQRQKKYLMQQLLLPKQTWQKLCFNQVITVRSTRGHQTNSTKYLANGQYPIIDQGRKKIAGYSNDDALVFKCPTEGIIVFGDHTREIKYIEFDFVVGADGTQLLASSNNAVLTKFLYYTILNAELPNDGYSRHLKYVKELPFYVPEIEKQQEIINILSYADYEIELLQEDISAEQQKKKALMQLLLTGIVRV